MVDISAALCIYILQWHQSVKAFYGISKKKLLMVAYVSCVNVMLKPVAIPHTWKITRNVNIPSINVDNMSNMAKSSMSSTGLKTDETAANVDDPAETEINFAIKNQIKSNCFYSKFN